MMEIFEKLLLSVYEPMFRNQFKYHPESEAIVGKIMAGNNSPELTELWFAEAEHYGWKHLTDKRTINDNGNSDGTIRFERFEGDA